MPHARTLLPRLALLAAGTVTAVALAELLLPVREPSPATAAEPPPQAASWVHHPSPWAWRFGDRGVDLPATVEAFSREAVTGADHSSHGFRTDEYTTARPPDTFRVVVLGDSLTWGQGVAFEDTFPEVLEGLLAERVVPVGLEAEVIAVGVCGARLVDHVIRLHAHVAGLEPDLLVLQHFPNDVEYLVDHREPDPLAVLKRESEILRLVDAVRLRDVYWRQLAAWIEPGSTSWRLYRRAAAEIARWRDASGTPVVVAAFPPSDQRPGGGNFDGYAELEAFRPLLEPPLEVLEDAGLPVLRLEEAFRREAGRRFLCVSTGDGHPNPLAHGIAARAIDRFLEGGGWLPRGAADVRPAASRYADELPLRREAAARWRELNRDYAAQRDLFDRLLDVAPGDPWLAAQAAHQRYEAGDIDGAAQLYRRLPELAPEVAAPWYHLARCTPEPAERKMLLELMLDAVPDHSPSLEELMWLHDRLGDGATACRLAGEVAAVARYPEQLERARAVLGRAECGGG